MEKTARGLNKFGRVFKVLVLGGAVTLGSWFALNNSKAFADDVLETNDVSFVTAIDSDGDGLTDADEIGIYGTDPNLADTDADGFLDGVEAVNPAIGDSLNEDGPGSGGKLYSFGATQNLTTGTLKMAASPVWLVGGKIAYIESDLGTESNPDFSDGELFVKNIWNMSEPRTGPLETGLSADLREICGGPLGKAIYYHKDDGERKAIYRVSIDSGEITKAVPTEKVPLEYDVRNPTVFATLKINTDLGELEVDTENDVWMIAETDNPDSSTGQLYAFRLNTSGVDEGLWDGSEPVQITDFPNKVTRPKISRDGENLMFVGEDGGNANLYVFQGVRDIVEGIQENFMWPHGASGDLRGDQIWVPSGVKSPIGFGGAGNFCYWVGDLTENHTLGSLNFSNSDFDVFCGALGVGSEGRFEVISPGAIRLPLPGNQISGAVSIDGSVVAFSDDYLSDGELGGNYTLYATSLITQVWVIKLQSSAE